jgi:hypothetical protein
MQQQKISLFYPETIIDEADRITEFLYFSIVWYSREHDVSETGSVSVLW